MPVTSGLVSPAQHHSSWRCGSQHRHDRGGLALHRQPFTSSNRSWPGSARVAGLASSRDTVGMLTVETAGTAAEAHSKPVPPGTKHHLRQALCEPAARYQIAESPPQATGSGHEGSHVMMNGNNIVPLSVSSPATAARLLHDHGSEAGTQEQPQLRQQQQEFQELRPQPNKQVSQQQSSGSIEPVENRIWLPDKQLWVPQNGHGIDSLGSRTAAIAGRAPSEQKSRLLKRRTLARVYMAASATRGRKRFMEDRHVLAALDPFQGVEQAQGPIGLQDKVSVAAVFDGHAGYATAAYAAQHIPNLLHEALSGRPGSRAEGGPVFPQRGLLAPTTALAASFHWFDRWWADARCDPTFTEHGWDDSGSTAVVGMVYGQDLVVANAGDSVALLARGGQSQRLTVEHRLDNEAEVERVLEAGGRVVSFKPGGTPRVMGTSSQTRFKGSMVTR
eukprot:GHUV01014915.1.p1 GENE.GHUV01014915.1~~GHUV01014915.1.p1  ORF type:complete len:446 (+),score=95.45 GHUV01014915.1:306-1643(+)